MECGWTEAVAGDLQALARLAALAPITPAEYAAAGYPSEEDRQEAEEAEGWIDDDLWRDDETLPLFGSRLKEARAVGHAAYAEAIVQQHFAGSWPALKTAVLGFLRTWPRNAPLLRGGVA